MRAGVLVVAKAPVAGLAKTRIAATVGESAAAGLAAAALQDTMDAVESWVAPAGRLMALTGDLSTAEDGAEIGRRLRTWTVIGQRGESFAARLVGAHRDAAALWGTGTVVVQIGMDTPQVTADDLDALAERTGARRVALGPAADGGWWGLATGRPSYVDPLVDVPMSRSDTAVNTVRAFAATGVRTSLVHTLHDVDTIDDAVAAAERSPGLRLARVVRAFGATTPA